MIKSPALVGAGQPIELPTTFEDVHFQPLQVTIQDIEAVGKNAKDATISIVLKLDKEPGGANVELTLSPDSPVVSGMWQGLDNYALQEGAINPVQARELAELFISSKQPALGGNEALRKEIERRFEAAAKLAPGVDPSLQGSLERLNAKTKISIDQIRTQSKEAASIARAMFTEDRISLSDVDGWRGPKVGESLFAAPLITEIDQLRHAMIQALAASIRGQATPEFGDFGI